MQWKSSILTMILIFLTMTFFSLLLDIEDDHGNITENRDKKDDEDVYSAATLPLETESENPCSSPILSSLGLVKNTSDEVIAESDEEDLDEMSLLLNVGFLFKLIGNPLPWPKAINVHFHFHFSNFLQQMGRTRASHDSQPRFSLSPSS